MIKRRSLLKSTVAAVAIALTSSAALCQSFFYNPAVFFPERILFVQADQTMFGAPVQPVAYVGPGHSTPATNSVWMSYVADKYTMLSPYDDTGSGFATTHTSLPACTLTNLFNAHNASFGAFTAAPDGTTNTAQKIVEDTSNNQHFVQAAWNIPQNPAILPFLRWAFIFKAAERTRFAIQINDRNASDTAVVGFDLIGGQIAYGPTYTGAASAAFPIFNQVINPVGGGFYLCYVDCKGLSLGSAPSSVRLLLDNGSGTAAQSTTYAGDGTSGLFGWKTSLLPVQAWKINSVSRFDDFNDPTLANVDKNATFAPGFDWYVQTGYAGWLDGDPIAPTGPTALSASGSILTYKAQTAPTPDRGLGTRSGGAVTSFGNATSRRPSPGVGTGWRPPVMIEIRMAYNYPQAFQPGDLSAWGGFIEFADAAQLHQPWNVGNATNGGEFDIVETGAFGNAWQGGAGAFFYQPTIGSVGNQFGSQIISLGATVVQIGFPPWQTNFASATGYIPGQTVGSGGNFYVAQDTAFTMPPSADWSQYIYPGTLDSSSVRDPNILTDPGQQHVYTNLFLPYDRITKDRGCRLVFFDGVFRSMPIFWSPQATTNDASNPYSHTIDWMRYFLILCADGPGSAAGSGYDQFVDYVRVSQ